MAQGPLTHIQAARQYGQYGIVNYWCFGPGGEHPSAVQVQAPFISPPSGTKALAATLKVYAFRSAGQASAQCACLEAQKYTLEY